MTSEPQSWQLLRGKINARQWKKDFDAAALAETLYDVYTGLYAFTDCPDPETYGLANGDNAADKGKQSFAGSSAAATATGQVIKGDAKKRDKKGRMTMMSEDISTLIDEVKKSADDPLDIQSRLALYKFNLDEYDKGRKIINKAVALLYKWVAPHLKTQLNKFKEDPKGGYDYLVTKYRTSDAAALAAATNSFERAFIYNYSSAQEYINAVESAREDMLDAGGDCNDLMMMNKLVRGMGTRGPWANFVTQYNMLRDVHGMETDLDSLITQILTFESTMAPRQSSNGGQKQYASTNNNARQAQGSPNYNRQRTQCSACGVWGHEEPYCWSVHPEKRPQTNGGTFQGARNRNVTTRTFVRETSRPNNGYRGPTKPSGMAATAIVQEDVFYDRLRQAEALSTPTLYGNTLLPPAPQDLADGYSQTNKLGVAALKGEWEGGRGLAFKGEEVQEFLFGLCSTSRDRSQYKNADTVVTDHTIPDSREMLSYTKPFFLLPAPPWTQLVSNRAYQEDMDEAIPYWLTEHGIIQANFEDMHPPNESWITKWLDSLPSIQNPAENIPAEEINRPTTPIIVHSPKAVPAKRTARTASISSRDSTTKRRRSKSCPPSHNDEWNAEMQSDDEEPSNQVCLAALTDVVHPEAWILDSGANVYVCNDPKWFQHLYTFDTEVNTASNGTAMKIAGGGTVSLELEDGDGDPFTLTLSDVAYAPLSRCNLLSISKLARSGIVGSWSPGGESMNLESPDGFLIAKAPLVNGLYHLKLMNQTMTSKVTARPIVANVDFNDPVWKEHRRLCHLSLERMARLTEQSEGMQVTAAQIKAKANITCPICATTKATVRIPRDPARRRFTEFGELLHADVWGPYAMEGWDKTRWMCFVTDDATRMTWTLRLIKLGDAPELLRKLTKMLEKTHDAVVRRFRVDNALNAGPWKLWCEKKGIELEPTAPYAHHQVGVAERTNRTLREGASSMIRDNSISGQIQRILTTRGDEMLRNTTMPEALWPEAMQYAAWNKNRSPTSTLKWKKTPYEAATGHKPDLTKERTWGSRVYVSLTHEQTNRKLHDMRGWLGYFVGCENESTYRVWHPDERIVKRVVYAQVEDGEGLEDSHALPGINMREDNTLAREHAADEHDSDTTANTGASRENDEDSDDEGIENAPVRNTGTTSRFFPTKAAMVTTRSKTGGGEMGWLERVRLEEELPEDFDPSYWGDGADALEYEEVENALEQELEDDAEGSEYEDAEDHNAQEETNEDSFLESDVPIQWGTPVKDDAVAATPQTQRRKRNKEIQPLQTSLDFDDERDDNLPETPQQIMRRTSRRISEALGTPDHGENDEIDLSESARDIMERALRRATTAEVSDTELAPQARPKKRRQTLFTGGSTSGISSMIPRRSTRKTTAQQISVSESDSESIAPAKKRKRPEGKRAAEPKPAHGMDADSNSEDDVPLKPKRDESQRGTRLVKRVREEDKCQYCYDRVLNCEPVPGGDCRQCTEAQRKCVPLTLNDDGTLPAKPWFSRSTRKDPRIPYDEYCYTCRRRNRRCDATQPINPKNPCTFCRKHNSYCIPWEQGVRMNNEPKCLACKRVNKRCDRNQPCDQCLEAKHSQCTYELENGTRRITCLTNPIRPNQRKHKLDPNVDYYNPEDRPGCKTCKFYYKDNKQRVACDFTPGGPPCSQCFNRNVPNANRCVNWTAPGRFESVATRMFKVDETSGGLVPDPSKIKNHTKKPKVPRGAKGAELETSDSSDDDGSEEEPTDIYSEESRATARQKLKNVRLPESYLAIRTINPWFQDQPISLAAISAAADAALLPDPQSYAEAMKSADAEQWRKAIQAEYNSLMENHTWDVVDPPKDRKPLTTKWVLKKKLGPKGEVLKYKARMVARGFQQVEGFDFTETYSGVVKAAAWRLLFAMLVLCGWTCHQMDVATAFLNGEVTEDIFIHAPQGYPEPNKVLKLRKALYGLKQAPRQWYRKLRQWLEMNEWNASNFDECVFYNEKLQLIITVYVDDINIFGPTSRHIQTFKSMIARTFKMTDAGEAAWYLGMQLERQGDDLLVHQAAFVNQMLNRYNLQGVTTAKVPLDPNRKLTKETSATASPECKTEFMSKTGSVNYLQSKTRWELAFPVSLISRYMTNPNQEHMDAVHQQMRYVAGTERRGLKFYAAGDRRIRGYVDSDWGGCQDTGRSTTGWVFTLAGCPISWASQRQKTVSSSSTEAEYVAASDACKEAIWLKGFYNEICDMMGESYQESIPLGIDNASAIKLTKNPEFHGRTKHINIRHHFIRECVQRGDINPVWISGKENPADLFTKPLHKPTFSTLVSRLGGEGGVADSNHHDHMQADPDGSA